MLKIIAPRPCLAAVALVVLATPLAAQLSPITSGQVLPDMLLEDFNSQPDGPIAGTHASFVALHLADVSLIGTFRISGDDLDSTPGNGALCSRSNVLTVSASGGMIDNPAIGGGNGWRFDLAPGATATQVGFIIADEGFGSPLAEIAVFFGGVQISSLGVSNPSTSTPHLYESAAPFDRFEIRATSSAGGWAVDDVMLAGYTLGGPTCVINSPLPGAMISGVVDLDHDLDHMLGSPVDATYEFSTDAGATWALCTPASGLNPELGIVTPAPGRIFSWDPVADGAGVAVVQAADLRVTADDGSVVAECDVTGLQLDNTALCGGICGDCNEDASGPNILDSLVSAQIAAGVVLPTAGQMACCDVDSSSSVTILDALQIAQDAAGLPVTLICP